MTDTTARTTWTPGPWRTSGKSSWDNDRISAPDGTTVCRVSGGGPIADANAGILAAAPEMATFLHWLEDSPDAISIDGGLSDEAEQRLRALLARIEGER